ncbi:MAG: guanylate kinase [Clostridiales bacterium]|jgi:guanylate kinase|nr:guanylate kinase [Clostridiales bacterium]
MGKKRGRLIIISGPSGVGKGTVVSILMKKCDNLIKSVSITTRKPRAGEVDGVNYFFRSVDEYLAIKEKDGFLETFQIYGNYYGTPAEFVNRKLSEGKNVLLEIDVQGALEVKRKMPEALLIFIAPPSLEELKDRLKGRNTEDKESFKKRLSAAEAEIKRGSSYDFCVINDDAERAAEEIREIIERITLKQP